MKPRYRIRPLHSLISRSAKPWRSLLRSACNPLRTPPSYPNSHTNHTPHHPTLGQSPSAPHTHHGSLYQHHTRRYLPTCPASADRPVPCIRKGSWKAHPGSRFRYAVVCSSAHNGCKRAGDDRCWRGARPARLGSLIARSDWCDSW